MSKVSEIESAIERLPENEFHMLAAWVEQRSRMLQPNQVAHPVVREGIPTRDHSAFLNSYVPEDEGLYDDITSG